MLVEYKGVHFPEYYEIESPELLPARLLRFAIQTLRFKYLIKESSMLKLEKVCKQKHITLNFLKKKEVIYETSGALSRNR